MTVEVPRFEIRASADTRSPTLIVVLAPATTLASKPLGQWNSYEITAQANKITVILNGQQVSQLNNANRSPKGFIGLQNHHFGSRVQFRNLRIKPL